MSSGIFRGKESSNRIKLSQLVQDLLNFGVLGSLWLWGWGRWMGGHLGHGACSHTHAHAHACMHMHTCTHAHLYMYRNCKWPPTWRHPCLACLTCLTCMCMCVCVYVHACTCMHAWETLNIPIPTPTPIHSSATPYGGGPQNHLKFDNTSTYQDISIPFEDLKSVKNSPSMDGCVVWWVGEWLGGLICGSGQITKNLKIVD